MSDLIGYSFTPLNSNPACSTDLRTSSTEAVPVTARVLADGVASQVATHLFQQLLDAFLVTRGHAAHTLHDGVRGGTFLVDGIVTIFVATVGSIGEADARVEEGTAVGFTAEVEVALLPQEAFHRPHAAIEFQQGVGVEFAALAVLHPSAGEGIGQPHGEHQHRLGRRPEVFGPPSETRLLVERSHIGDTEEVPVLIVNELQQPVGEGLVLCPRVRIFCGIHSIVYRLCHSRCKDTIIMYIIVAP